MLKNITPVFLIIFAISISGCSSNPNNSLTPKLPTQKTSLDLPDLKIFESDDNYRILSNIWTMHFDVKNQKIEIIENRQNSGHWNVKRFMPAPIVNINHYNPTNGILDIDVTLTNTTELDAYDVRLIVYTDNYGIRLVNPDNWTSLFDIPGGASINPFKAYAKAEQKRVFKGLGTQHKENLQIYFPSGSKSVEFAIDASWPSSCLEPYAIKDFTHDKLYDSLNASAHILLKVNDWQNDVNDVRFYCPSITGESFIQLERKGTFDWGTKIENSTGALGGTYIGIVIAKSSGSDFTALYDVVYIVVSPRIGWARSWGSSDYDAARAIAVDNIGNIYVTGNYSGTVDFDPSAGMNQHTSSGYDDIYVCKYDPTGNLQWAQTWGGEYWNDNGFGLTVDSSGNVYVTGRFMFATVDFDPGLGYDWHTTQGWEDIFLSKFDTNGNFLWAKTWGSDVGDYGEIGYDVALDEMGNVYVTGNFKGTADFDPGDGEDNHISYGAEDIFLSKFASNGDFIWARTWGGIEGDSGRGLSVDSWNNVYVTGGFRGTVDFNTGEDIEERYSQGEDDIFISKFDSDGNFIFTRTWGGLSYDYGLSATNDNSGNIFITGYYVDVVDFNPDAGEDIHTSNGGNDIFLSKFTSSGDFLYALTWGGINWNEEGWDVSIDDAGNVYVSGRFVYTPVDFDPGPGEDWHYSKGWDEIFLSKFNNDGEYQWARTWGGGWIEEYGDIGYGTAVDPEQNVFVCGSFKDQGDFDPGESEDIQKSNGVEDAFLIKFLSNGNWD